MPDSQQLHATAVAIDGRGILLLGDSGAGKSDLALRLVDRGAQLIADDRVDLTREETHVVMSAPRRIAGLIELRGLGIYRTQNLARAPLAMAVRLVPRQVVERLPERAAEPFLGIDVPLICLDPFELSAPIRVEWALHHARVSTESVL